MKNSFFKAKLTSLRKITAMVFSDLPEQESDKFFFTSNNNINIPLKMIRIVSISQLRIMDFELPFDFPFGKKAALLSMTFGETPIDIKDVTYFPEFDDLFNYDGDDLGAIYHKEETSFALWAPLADSVLLNLELADGSFFKYEMKRGEKGVYRIKIKGDLLNRKYQYVVSNSGVVSYTIDPYGKGMSLNSEYSAVVDYLSLQKDKKIKPKTSFNKYIETTIYELHIRDFTEDKHTDIVNKGKYLGLCEENRKTTNNHPAGLDYLKYLGISHVQLQPILDCNGLDNKNIEKDYNWGYDPISMFALEGSYSLKPEVPQERLNEFKTLIDTLHKNDIRVNIDVVYNHVADYLSSAFNKVLPNYFFRRRKNGLLAMASGCGNDFASERYMARKAIVDSCLYLLNTFDIDGLRFDLMGLIDIDTIKEVNKKCTNIKKDFMIYGEGWNMGYELPFEKKACSENASKLPNIAFFNDAYRDIVKGETFDLYKKGFAAGDFDYVYGFEFAFMGSCVNKTFPMKFNNANQSINYVECHDNHTLFDKFSLSNDNESEEEILSRVLLATTLTVLSFGVPYLHMGQEIGLSKCGLGNTYNVPKVNNMDYALLDNRFSMVDYVKCLISLRNNELSFLKEMDSPKEIESIFTFEEINGNLLKISLKEDSPLKDKYKDLLILVNVSNNPIPYSLDDYHDLIFLAGGRVNKKNPIIVKDGCIAARSVDVLIKH